MIHHVLGRADNITYTLGYDRINHASPSRSMCILYDLCTNWKNPSSYVFEALFHVELKVQRLSRAPIFLRNPSSSDNIWFIAAGIMKCLY